MKQIQRTNEEYFTSKYVAVFTFGKGDRRGSS